MSMVNNGFCSSFFNLALKYPHVVLALSLSYFANQLPANPAPGNMLGTEQIVAQAERNAIAEHPEIAQQVIELQEKFKLFNGQPTDEQLDTFVFRKTDRCTDLRAKNLTGPDRKEAEWLFLLDRFGREGPTKAEMFFRSNIPPPKKR